MYINPYEQKLVVLAIISLTSMVKGKSQLLTHHASAQPSQPSKHKFVTLSNTSKRVRKVFTASTSSSLLVEKQNELEQELIDSGQSIIMDDWDCTPAEIANPANISVCTKAKRYQNSVRQCHHCIRIRPI
jgi:hypothetical protein